MAGRRGSGEGWDHEKRQGESSHTHTYYVLPLQPVRRAKGTPHTFTSVLLVKKENKFLLNILSSRDRCLPLLSYSLRQALCHSNVSRGDMVACTPLCVWALWVLSSKEAVANQLFQSWLDRDILYGGVEIEGKKRREEKKKEKKRGKKKKKKKRDLRWQVAGGDNDPSQSPCVLIKNSWQTPASGSSAVGFRCLFFYSSALIPMHCLCLALLSIPSATEHDWKNKNPRLSNRHVQKKMKLLKSFLTLMRTQAIIPQRHTRQVQGECKLGVSILSRLPWIGECTQEHQVILF